ncbi:hypothetical protein BV210_13575 [Halorientalis sp. IM1011]|uniref:hypothetical protein n=1 Tax=Halorientalis sp. IM1011 TaxID=1932360 RepID=UPI00097CCA4D|nr:hypothetical protein [Halorientalis sp. IM1011]AQL43667.1 hypothetical protein BV210_13575 [Halorientalis sp. IM1011]
MLDTIERSRRRFLTGTAVAVFGGLAGCTGNDDGSTAVPETGTDATATDTATATSTRETDEAPASTAEADTPTDPEETRQSTADDAGYPMHTVERFLTAIRRGEPSEARKETVEGHDLGRFADVEKITIFGIERYTPQKYADYRNVTVSAVEDTLQQVEERGYDDSAIVSYTVRTDQHGEIRRYYVVVLDGDRWLMYDYGLLPE